MRNQKLKTVCLLLATTFILSGCTNPSNEKPKEPIGSIDSTDSKDTKDTIPQAITDFGFSTNEEPVWVSMEEGGKGGLTKEIVTKIPPMDSLSVQIPTWCGTTLAFDTLWREGRILFSEKDAANISNMGFNYVRLCYNYYDFMDENGRVNQTVLNNMDSIIHCLINNGLHVNLDMHALPGYGVGIDQSKVDLLSNEENYQRSIDLWEMLAKRYAEVPAAALSYNLVNEPTLFYFTQENYADFVSSLSSVILSYDSEKMLLSDGMLGDRWCGEFGWDSACPSSMNTQLDSSVAQSLHLYPYDSNSESGYINLTMWPYEHMPAVSGYIHDDHAIRITGNFQEGTQIDLHFEEIYGANEGLVLQCKAGKTNYSFQFDGIEAGQENCLDIFEDNGKLRAFFDNMNNDGLLVSFALEEAADEISLLLNKGDCNVNLKEVFFRIPSEQENTYLVPNNANRAGFGYETSKCETRYYRFVGEYSDVYSILHLEDTLPTATNEMDADCFDMETLRNYIQGWKQWSMETGSPIICNELGVPIGLPKEVRMKYLSSVLSLFQENEIPWCLYTNQYENWGPVVHQDSQSFTTLPIDGSLRKEGNYLIDDSMLEVLKSYQ